MGISKKLMMAEQELADNNEHLEMDEVDYEDAFCYPKNTAKLNQQKKSAQDDIEQLTVLAKGFGLINNQT